MGTDSLGSSVLPTLENQNQDGLGHAELSAPQTEVRGDYSVFLDRKSQLSEGAGFKPNYMPSFLIDFQEYLTDWALGDWEILKPE